MASTLHIEKNRYLLLLEMQDQSCYDVLTTRSKSLRFDICREQEKDTEQAYRAKLTLGAEDQMILELRDYRDNTRVERILDPSARVSDLSALALAMAWERQTP